MEYIFICPDCKSEIYYKSKQAYDYALKNIKKCKPCKLLEKGKPHIRNCPRCGKEILYKIKPCYKSAIKNNSLCASCRQVGHTVSKKTKNKIRDHHLEYYKNHPEAKLFLRNLYVGKTYEELHGIEESNRIKSIHSKNSSGKNNFFYGKSLYDVFAKKYGKNVADEKWENIKRDKSIRNSGRGNPMYGKPSPQGAGNGWSGWYKGWFFRSLYELSYMINVIERFNLKWKGMESKDMAIKYIDWDGKERNYFADFLVENKYVVEVKPKKLWNAPKTIAKRKYAMVWCKEKNLIYKLRCIPKIKFNEIGPLINSGKLKFTKIYEEKFKRYKND